MSIVQLRGETNEEFEKRKRWVDLCEETFYKEYGYHRDGSIKHRVGSLIDWTVLNKQLHPNNHVDPWDDNSPLWKDVDLEETVKKAIVAGMGGGA